MTSHFFNWCKPVWCTWWGYQQTKTVKNRGPHAIYEILHIECHIYHMSKCGKCNWNRYIEGFCMSNVHFHIIGLSPNIAYVILLNWQSIFFYWIIDYFCAVFISYLMVINSKKYKSKYPNTIWWILPCIMSELWK